MFRNDPEACQAIRILLGSIRSDVDKLWTLDGPTEECTRLFERGAPWSHGEVIVLKVCFDFWNGLGHTPFDEMIQTLDGRRVRLITELWQHHSAGTVAKFIVKHGR